MEKLVLKVFWSVKCFDSSGALKWSEDKFNLVVDEGKNYALENAIASATLFIGLTDGTPTPAAGDTMSSHAGWAEVTAYDEAARQAFTQGAVVAQSFSNTASPATFTISGATTVGGGFITTSSTKGGTTGTLFSVNAFNEGDRPVVASDQIVVTITISVA